MGSDPRGWLGAQLAQFDAEPPTLVTQPSIGALVSVFRDWPGFGTGALHEGRDLAPTQTLAQVLDPTLGRHYALSPERISALFA